jgi:hypothetical protein
VGGEHGRGRPYAAWADAAVKGALAATLVAAALAPGLREYSDRGVAGRFAAALAALAAVPAWWWLLGRRRSRHGYPYALDAVLALPFLLELWGNAAGAGGLAAGGAAGHVADFLLFATALALGLARLDLGPWVTAALVAGGGAVGAIAWELLEHATFATPSADRYEGTMEDLALALAASLAVAAAAGVVLARRGPARDGA